MNGNRLDDEDESPEVLDAVSTYVEDLLAVQQRLLGDARAAWRHLGRLAASLNAPDVAFPPPESTPAVLRAMEEVVEQLNRDLIRLHALARRAADRASRRRQVSADRSQAGAGGVPPLIVDRQADSPSSPDG